MESSFFGCTEQAGELGTHTTHSDDFAEIYAKQTPQPGILRMLFQDMAGSQSKIHPSSSTVGPRPTGPHSLSFFLPRYFVCVQVSASKISKHEAGWRRHVMLSFLHFPQTAELPAFLISQVFSAYKMLHFGAELMIHEKALLPS